jgi:hypothetical protein
MENQEQAQMETQAVGGEAPAGTPTPELTITDLINIRAVVDVAVRRGAFGAAEASAVGAAFDKLNTFLNAVAPAKTEEQPPAQ